MRQSIRLALAAAAATAFAGAAWAHHNSMEGYDASAPVILSGEVSSVDWSGEHALVRMKTPDGKQWKVQAAPVKTMRENGLDEAAFGAKEKVVIRGYQSKDKACKPECLAAGADITFSDGLKMKLDGTHAKDAAKAVHDQRVAVRAKLGL